MNFSRQEINKYLDLIQSHEQTLKDSLKHIQLIRKQFQRELKQKEAGL